jgi:hypothetical protein
MIHFSLSSHINAALFDNSIIILDAKTNKYLSLIGPAAQSFSQILDKDFIKKDDSYFFAQETDDLAINSWIHHFLEKNFIITCDDKNSRKGLAAKPIKEGGLKEYEWQSKTSMNGVFKASKWQIIKAFFTLAKVHRIMNKKGIAGVIDLISRGKKSSKDLSEQAIKELSIAVDGATFFYPKKTFCLAWAMTFLVLVQKKGYKCDLVIGVQTNPFYAHAWAQAGNLVINDDPSIAQVLSIILKVPNY